MAVEKLISGLSLNSLPPKLQIYLMCCPSMDLNLRFLPREGGLMEQNYDDVFYFKIIEGRIKEILLRNRKKNG